MGRPTVLTERFPDGSDFRSRFSLGYFHHSNDPTANPCSVGATLADPARVKLSSEWIDGADWPGCTDLNWTIAEYDGLNRSRVQRLPDGSRLDTEYIGAGNVTTTRKVKTSISGAETDMVTIATSDGLGRLRHVEEQENAGSFINSYYQYDAKDRLLSVEVGTDPDSQIRSFVYSPAGFLMSSEEPELYTQYFEYDALGNVLEKKTARNDGDVGVDCHIADPPICTLFNITYDPTFHRLEGTYIDENATSIVVYGDVYGDVQIGDPDFNKVVRSEHFNRYPDIADGVHVAHDWWHNGPGGRVSNRKTTIDGIGEAGDGFSLVYHYDKWGNVAASSARPRVSGWSWLSWRTTGRKG